MRDARLGRIINLHSVYFQRILFQCRDGISHEMTECWPRMSQGNYQITSIFSLGITKACGEISTSFCHVLVDEVCGPCGDGTNPFPARDRSAEIRSGKIEQHFSTSPIIPTRMPARSNIWYSCKCSGTRDVVLSIMLLRIQGYIRE